MPLELSIDEREARGGGTNCRQEGRAASCMSSPQACFAQDCVGLALLPVASIKIK